MTNEQTTVGRKAIERIDGTVIPLAFESFVHLMERISEIEHKGTVSVFKDANGTFVSLIKQGSNNKQINLVCNKSRGWNCSKEYKRLIFELWHTGDVRVVVSKHPKAIKQAYKFCREWKELKPYHKPTVTVTGEKKGNKKRIKRFPRP